MRIVGVFQGWCELLGSICRLTGHPVQYYGTGSDATDCCMYTRTLPYTAGRVCCEFIFCRGIAITTNIRVSCPIGTAKN